MLIIKNLILQIFLLLTLLVLKVEANQCGIHLNKSNYKAITKLNTTYDLQIYDLIRDKVLKLRHQESVFSQPIGGSTFEGIVIQATILRNKPIEDFIDFYKAFPDSGYDITSFEHLIIVSTSYRLLDKGYSPNQVIHYFNSTKFTTPVPIAQQSYILQTALLTGIDLKVVADYFKNFERTPWRANSANHNLAIQTSLLIDAPQKDIIKFFHKLPLLNPTSVINGKVEFLTKLPFMAAHRNQAFITQTILLLNNQ